MSEPTYTLTISESERTAMAKVLGGLVTKLINAPIFVESPTGGTAAARAVLSSPPPTSQADELPPSPPSGHVPPQTPQQRDRWARDRKGNEVPMPDGYAAREVTIWKTEQKPAKKEGGKPFLKVTWQSQDRGYVDANCFDSQLFPWLIKQQGQRTTIYLVKSGQYLNVVGVRA